jgi:hypothetical protein
MATLLDWNGKELPRELRALPTGRYVIEPVDRVLDLTAEEEEGLETSATSAATRAGIQRPGAKSSLPAQGQLRNDCSCKLFDFSRSVWKWHSGGRRLDPVQLHNNGGYFGTPRAQRNPRLLMRHPGANPRRSLARTRAATSLSQAPPRVTRGDSSWRDISGLVAGSEL